MRVLLTGAGGFLGRAVLKELTGCGDEVVATSKRAHTVLAGGGSVPWVCQDLNEPREDYFELFHQPESIVHLAWEGLPRYRELHHIERNLMSSYQFLRRMVESGVSRITVVGTCLEYGLVEGCLAETLIPQPMVPYAVAKDALRRFLEQLAKVRGFSLKWIRLFYVHGGGEIQGSLIGQLRAAIARGDEYFPMSGGEQLRDYLPVDVAARLIVRITRNETFSGVVNCCSGKPISVRRLVERVIEEERVSIKPKLGSLPYSEYEPMAFWGDVTRLRRVTGGELT